MLRKLHHGASREILLGYRRMTPRGPRRCRRSTKDKGARSMAIKAVELAQYGILILCELPGLFIRALEDLKGNRGIEAYAPRVQGVNLVERCIRTVVDEVVTRACKADAHRLGQDRCRVVMIWGEHQVLCRHTPHKTPPPPIPRTRHVCTNGCSSGRYAYAQLYPRRTKLWEV